LAFERIKIVQRYERNYTDERKILTNNNKKAWLIGPGFLVCADEA
jgi:hypothetical protein